MNEGLPAGEFLASILSDALQNTDAGFLQARVAVAKFVAQPHSSARLPRPRPASPP